MKQLYAFFFMLTLVLMFTGCQGAKESNFTLQTTGAKSVSGGKELVIETAMEQSMLDSIDVNGYLSKGYELKISYLTSDGKEIAAADQKTQVVDDIQIDTNGKTLNSLILTTTMVLSDGILEDILEKSTKLLIKDIKFGGKSYKNFTIILPDDIFLSHVLKEGTYAGTMHYTDELSEDGKIDLSFKASDDGLTVTDFVVEMTKVSVVLTETVPASEVESLPSATITTDESVTITTSLGEKPKIEISPYMSAEFALEGTYKVEDSAFSIENAYLKATANVDSKGNVTGKGEFSFMYRSIDGNMYIKHFGEVDITASPE